MNKKILTRDEVKTLELINTLQNKINEITYIEPEFNKIMARHFKNTTKKYSEEEQTRLRITLFNLEELNLIEGDILVSPRMTEEGKEILEYYRERNRVLYGTIGAIMLFSIVSGVMKIFKK